MDEASAFAFPPLMASQAVVLEHKYHSTLGKESDILDASNGSGMRTVADSLAWEAVGVPDGDEAGAVAHVPDSSSWLPSGVEATAVLPEQTSSRTIGYLLHRLGGEEAYEDAPCQDGLVVATAACFAC